MFWLEKKIEKLISMRERLLGTQEYTKILITNS